MELGRSRAEVELTKKLAATLVQKEVMEPMAAMGWRHGTPPTPEQAALHIAKRAEADGATPEQIAAFLAERGVTTSLPAGGQPVRTEGAPAPATTPAAPVKSGQPAPTAASPAPTTPAKTDSPDLEAARNVLSLMESLRDPATGKIMGKYDDVAGALKGAGHLANMAKSALGRAEAAEAALGKTPAPVAASPVTAPVTAAAPRTFTPASRADVDAAQERLDAVLSKVTENGGVLDADSARALSKATRELSKAEAAAVVEDSRRASVHATGVEKDKWDGVNEYMLNKYPDSANFSDEVGLHTRSNPLLAEAVMALVAQGREQRAAELAWTEFDKSRGGTGQPVVLTRAEAEVKESDLAAREQVRKEQRDAALKDAGIVHGSAGGSSAVETPGVTGPSQDEISRYADQMRREGEAPGSAAAARWRHAVIGRFLPPELFGS
jgi:hypothetical protein